VNAGNFRVDRSEERSNDLFLIAIKEKCRVLLFAQPVRGFYLFVCPAREYFFPRGVS
jgi:hypothetical protein